ncbi:MAG: hypothetical protein WEC84_00250 [Candidatus Andersenbacteria bacterium]
MNQRVLIISLSSILLLVIVASAVVLLYLPGDEDAAAPGQGVGAPLTGVPASSNGNTFNTSVLNTSGYTSLDVSLIQSGRLPVKPPVTTGKANPFL